MTARRPTETGTDQRDLARVQKEIHAELERITAEAPSKGFGAPSGLHTQDHRAQYGDLLWCDPTNGAMKVWLPKGDRQHLGDKVTVKNYSSSTNTITVAASSQDTIDKENHKDLAIAWELATFLLVAEDKWICFKGDGCL